MTQIIVLVNAFFFLYSKPDQQKLKCLYSLTMSEFIMEINSVTMKQFLSGIKNS